MTLLLLQNLKIILVTANYMNILDAEEMAEVEKLLLLQESHQPYTVIPLETSLVPILQDFTSSYFLPPTQQIQQQAQRLVTNARNIKSVNREDPNSLIKMFNRSVFAIIFPTPNPITKAGKEEVNDLLLETLKCSLYSKDLNFNHIVNKKISVDNLQAKCMMSKFFHSLEVAKQLSNAQKIRYIEWSLEKNQLLQQLFILFYRIILGKLYVDGADDYDCSLNFQEAITNLIEYFDINYRNFGELFLVPQQNYFLASVNTHFILGEYVQNGGYKGKESLKTTDEKLLQQSLGVPGGRGQSNKKNAVIDTDIKLFNFILESGRSSHNLNDKDLDAETPHFKDSHQFAFGKKRKDEEQVNRQQEIKKQFQKFFMNSQAESIQEGEANQTLEDGNQLSFYPQLAGLPLRLSQQFQTRPRNQTESDQNAPAPQPSFFKKSTFQQSLIDELESQVKDQPQINPENHHKNIVVVKDKNIATFSPQISNNMHCAGFSNFINDAMFFDQEGNGDLYKSSSGQNVENFVPCACEYKWVQRRIKRNKITSKVVEFVYFQSKTQRAPKFVQNLKYSQNLSINNKKVKAFPKESLNLKQYPSSKEIRKPSFLNFLKKNRQAGEKSHSSHSRSKKSVGKKSTSAKRQKINHFQLDKQTINRINNNCTAYSTIITKNPLDLRSNFLTSKSATKRNENLSPTKIAPVAQSVIKNFDSRYLYHRPAFGTSWKTVEHAFSPKIEQRQKQVQSGMFQSGRNERVRVYAPVNIIAPTVYFNGVTERDNRVIFTVNNEGGPRDRDTIGPKISDRHLRTETHYFPRQRIANPQINRYI